MPHINLPTAVLTQWIGLVCQSDCTSHLPTVVFTQWISLVCQSDCASHLPTAVLSPDTTVQTDFFLSTVTTFVFKPTDILLLLHYKKGCLRCLLSPVVMETKQNGHQTTCK